MTTYSRTMREMVAERPARARVFEEAGIDYCSDEQTLTEACHSRGVDPDNILDRLENADRKADSAVRNWAEIPLGELCDCIVKVYHAPLKQELPRIGMLLYRVAEGDGERHPELHRVLELFSLFSGDLKLHLTKEEEIFFRMVTEIEADAHDHDLSKLIECLEAEHEHALHALDEMRNLTHDFNPPSDACSTYKAVMDALRNLTRDLHEHLGIENNILFPRVFRSQFAEI